MGAFGLAMTARLIAIARGEAANSLVMDNGDFLQGNPLSDYIAYHGKRTAGTRHSVIAAMEAAGIEVAALGNHEFNYGLEFLMSSLAGAGFPVVSANVLRVPPPETERRPRHAGAAAPLVPPYVILPRTVTDGAGRRQRLKIGVIGFTPPQIMTWDRDHLDGRVTVRDIVETAREMVPRIRAAGADLVIALAHTGIGPDEHRPMMENAAIPLARVDGIDALVGGHIHAVFPAAGFAGDPSIDPERGTIAGVPAVMAGFWGAHLGVIDLMVERTNGRWKVIAHECAVRGLQPSSGGGADRQPCDTGTTPGRAPPPSAGPPPLRAVGAVMEAARADHVATLAYIRRPVGSTRRPLHSYFSLLHADRALRVVADAKSDYLARLVAGTEHEGVPILATASPCKCGGWGGPQWYTDIAPGDVALRGIADLYLFPNYFRSLLLTGAGIAEWLERSAAIYRQIAPGASDEPLINPLAPSTHYDVIFGLRYDIDASVPARYDAHGRLVAPESRRIRNLRLADGQPLDPEATCLLATNSYRAAGGGNFPGAGAGSQFLAGPDAIRDILRRYLHANSPLAPETDPVFGLRGAAGARVLFDTGPGAERHLSEIAHLSPEPLGLTAQGFLRLRLHL